MYKKRAPEMTNDCGLKQAERERERKKNVFIRNYMWMARSAAERCDVNLCLVHKWREDARECTEEEKKHKHRQTSIFLLQIFFFKSCMHLKKEKKMYLIYINKKK